MSGLYSIIIKIEITFNQGNLSILYMWASYLEKWKTEEETLYISLNEEKKGFKIVLWDIPNSEEF